MLVGAIAAAAILELAASAVDVVGVTTGGLGGMGLPTGLTRDWFALIPGGLAVVLLGYTESLDAVNLAAGQTKKPIREDSPPAMPHSTSSWDRATLHEV